MTDLLTRLCAGHWAIDEVKPLMEEAASQLEQSEREKALLRHEILQLEGIYREQIERLQRELDEARKDQCNYYGVSMEELQAMIAARQSQG